VAWVRPGVRKAVTCSAVLIASTAVTTGLFVLAGVIVGGLVTGAVNYAFEWRRERVSARVAMRLLEAELAIAAASADWRLEQGAWTAWNFGRAHRAWSEYRSDIARAGISSDEWYAVERGFYAIEIIESVFANKADRASLEPHEQKALNTASANINEGANTIRQLLGLKPLRRF